VLVRLVSADSKSRTCLSDIDVISFYLLGSVTKSDARGLSNTIDPAG